MKEKEFSLGRLGSGVALSLVLLTQSGCWLIAAGVGGEAVYVGTQEDRTAAETVEDQAIVTSVHARILAEPKLSNLSINVDSFKGNVTLRGLVKSYEAEQRAIQIARSVSGVKSVTSKLHVD